jgi:hypothetical protein
MDFKYTDKPDKNNIIKSLEELQVAFNGASGRSNDCDCSKNLNFCKFQILLSQTINKTISYLDTHNENSKNKNVLQDININYEQLSSFTKKV